MDHAIEIANAPSDPFQRPRVVYTNAKVKFPIAVSKDVESVGLFVGWRMVGMRTTANIHNITAMTKSCHMGSLYNAYSS